MAITPIFCCGFEEGLDTGYNVGHWTLSGATIQATTKRTGTYALKCNPSAGQHWAYHDFTYVDIVVARFYVYFATLPNANVPIAFYYIASIYLEGVFYKSSDSKIYAGFNSNLGATGVSVTTSQWYCIDVKVDVHANPHKVDVQVDGVACGQKSTAVAAESIGDFNLGNYNTNCTGEWYYDDVILSATTGDYPIGAGKVLPFLATSDGTHSFTLNDFLYNAAGGSIAVNATDVYTYLDELPLAGGGDFINQAITRTTGYVEVCFADTTEANAPRGVEVMIVNHQTNTNSGTSTFKLYDNTGTTEDTVLARSGAGSTTLQYATKQYAARPAALGAWTVAAFNDLRFRFGYSSDAAPDQYFDGVLVEAEFAVAAVTNQAVGGGSLASASTLNRTIFKGVGAGAVSTASAVNRLIAKTIGSGAVGLAGALGSIFKQFASVGSGSLTIASTLGRMTAKSIGNGAISIAGAVNRLIQKNIGAGAVGLASTLGRVISKTIGSGSVGFASTLGRLIAMGVGGGAVGIASTLWRMIAKTIGSGAVGIASMLGRLIARGVGGGDVSTASIVNRLIIKTIGSGAVGLASTLGRLIARGVGGGTVSLSGALSAILLGATIFYQNVGSGAVSLASKLGRNINRAVGSGSLTIASTLGRLISKAIGSGSVGIASTLGRKISKTIGTGSVGIASTLGRMIARGVGGGAVGIAGALSPVFVGVVIFFQSVGNGAVAISGTLSFFINRILRIFSKLSTLFGITSKMETGLKIESRLGTEYTIVSFIDTEYLITSLLTSGLTITSEFAEK